MKMKTKLLTALLTAALCLGMLAGCAGNDTTNNEQPQGTSSASGETNNAPTADSTDDKEPPYQVGDAFVTSNKEQYEKYQALKEDALKRASEITEDNAEAVYIDKRDITWLYKDDIIVLRGVGEARAPQFKIKPWEDLPVDFRDAVRIIVVDEGITELGELAISWFGKNGEIDAIILPESLNSIKEDSVNNSVSAIFFPNKEVEVAEYGIDCSTGPEYVDIGKSKLENIFMDDLQTITMSSEHPYYVMEKNAVYTKDMKTLVRITDIAAKEFEIPVTVTTIGKTAFSGCGLTSITIPDNVTDIEECAFMWCPHLDSVILSDYVEMVGTNAFMNCSISEIYMGKAIWENPGHIGSQSPLVAVKITVHAEHSEYKVYTGSLNNKEYEGLLCDKDNTPLMDGLYWHLYEKN